MNVYDVAQTTTMIFFCLILFTLNLISFNGQEENMELKRQKTQLGEPLKWTDYLSLPFTQNVRTQTHIGQYTKYLLQ